MEVVTFYISVITHHFHHHTRSSLKVCERLGVVHGCMEVVGGARCRKRVVNNDFCTAIILLHININDRMLW